MGDRSDIEDILNLRGQSAVRAATPGCVGLQYINDVGLVQVDDQGQSIPLSPNVSFLTPVLDFLTPHNPGITWIPALPGYYFVPTVTRMLIVAWTTTGSTTQGPQVRAGNDTNITNLIGNGQNATVTPSAATINAAALQASEGISVNSAQVPFWCSAGFQAGRMLNLATPVRFDIVIGVQDPLITTVCRARFLAVGQLLHESLLAP